MSTLHVAPARIEDIPAVLALERSIFDAPHWPETQFFAILQQPLRRHLVVARVNGVIAGFAVGALLGDEADLENLAVHPGHRRAGLARALCAAIMEWAWARGASTLTLEVRSAGVGAIALYRSLGFAEEGRRRGYYINPSDDALLMRLRR